MIVFEEAIKSLIHRHKVALQLDASSTLIQGTHVGQVVTHTVSRGGRSSSFEFSCHTTQEVAPIDGAAVTRIIEETIIKPTLGTTT